MPLFERHDYRDAPIFGSTFRGVVARDGAIKTKTTSFKAVADKALCDHFNRYRFGSFAGQTAIEFDGPNVVGVTE